MDLYEYQGKELFRQAGIPVSEGRLATTPAEARQAAEALGGPVVVKAQVLTGGRGKAGGIQLADSPEDAEARARDILPCCVSAYIDAASNAQAVRDLRESNARKVQAA